MSEKKQVPIRWKLAALFLFAALGPSSCKREPEVPLPPVSNELLLKLASDPIALAEGKNLFVTVCSACHAVEGQGLVGPNLTDSAWIHGAAPLEIHTSVSKGFPEKGMTPFENLLGPARVRLVTAYVLTLKGKNLPGKPPEGKVEPGL